jgi:hypothetical protein
VDSAWEIARDDDSTAADALGKMRMTPYKVRDDLTKAIRIEYRDGAFTPLDGPVKPASEIVISLITLHPGLTQKQGEAR